MDLVVKTSDAFASMPENEQKAYLEEIDKNSDLLAFLVSKFYENAHKSLNCGGQCPEHIYDGYQKYQDILYLLSAVRRHNSGYGEGVRTLADEIYDTLDGKAHKSTVELDKRRFAR